MQLIRSVEAFGTDDFEDVLIDELSEDSHFDSQELGSEAGGNTDGEIVVLDYEGSATHILAEILFSFEEVIPSGCRDNPFVRPRNHRYRLTIDKQTAEYELKTEENDEPEF